MRRRPVGDGAGAARRLRRLAAAAGTAALLLAAPGAAGEPAAGFPAGYVSEVLSNGVRVSILPEPGNPVVATQVWYHVGAANEDEGSRGLAHLFEHLMFGETTTRPPRDYWDHHHRHGGRNNAYTSPDETVYVSEIAPPHHVGVLEREADRMVNLVLSQENLDNEIRIVTEELRLSTENDPLSRVFHQATAALLGDHPYSVMPTGTREDVAAADLDSCRRFYERFYGPANAHVVVVGPVDAQATLAAVRRSFGRLPARGETPADVPALDGWPFPDEVELREDLPPVEIAIQGFPLPPAGSPDHWPLAVLKQLLAGGSVDPFREELVRRRRQAVEAGTEALSLRRGGAVVFYSVNLPYRRKRTAFRRMDRARAELSRLEWLTEESLAAARRSLKRVELERVQFAARRAAAIGRAHWWTGDERRAFDGAERIDAVTLEQVRAAYRKYVGEPTPVRLYLRPERVPLRVRLFGWLYPLVGR